MLRIVDFIIFKRYNQRCTRAGYLAQPTEVGGSVLKVEVLLDV